MKPTLSIVVIAYNAQQNIVRLLTSLVSQQTTRVRIQTIMVYSDQSSDNTVKRARSVHDPRIKVISTKKRQGFAANVKQCISSMDTQYLTLLNDDIVIRDDYFIDAIMEKFLSEKDVGLVSSALVPIQGKNFIEQAVASGYLAYKHTALEWNNGNNKMTCDGKSLSISKQFAQAMNLDVPETIMGNVDTYLYLECIKHQFSYRFATNSILYFRCPSTAQDFIRWQKRNHHSLRPIVAHYGEFAVQQIQIPKAPFLKHRVIQFLKNPTGGIAIWLLGLYSYYAAQFVREFNVTWDLVRSTKELENV